MNSKLYFSLMLAFLSTFTLSAQIVVTDADLGNGIYTWTSDNVYLLDGYVFLEEGGRLNIEPGTRIEAKGSPSNGVDPSSALIIARGAQIFAVGTANEPIVFTAEGEDGTFDAIEDRGSWGGLIIRGVPKSAKTVVKKTSKVFQRKLVLLTVVVLTNQ
ncbi:MAG: hypothetical protein R2795_10740 [Saprospiraceae bacterium]